MMAIGKDSFGICIPLQSRLRFVKGCQNLLTWSIWKDWAIKYVTRVNAADRDVVCLSLNPVSVSQQCRWPSPFGASVAHLGRPRVRIVPVSQRYCENSHKPCVQCVKTAAFTLSGSQVPKMCYPSAKKNKRSSCLGPCWSDPTNLSKLSLTSLELAPTMSDSLLVPNLPISASLPKIIPSARRHCTHACPPDTCLCVARASPHGSFPQSCPGFPLLHPCSAFLLAVR